MKKGLKKAIAATVASVIFLSLAGCGASPAEASKSGTEKLQMLRSEEHTSELQSR